MNNTMLKTGEIVDGKYRIIKQLGFGGEAEAYLAIHLKTGQRRAIKAERNAGPMHVGGIMNEASILRRLSSDLFPDIIDVIEGRDKTMLVMEYIDGISMDKLISSGNTLDESRLIRAALTICDMLTFMHSCNPPIAFGDLKPANLMYLPSGDVRIIDFGAARELKSQVSHSCNPVYKGTRAYASPEQIAGDGSGIQGDIYSLGKTLYRLYHGNATGDFSGGKKISDLDKILLRAMSENASDRFLSAEEFKQELLEYLKYAGGNKGSAKKRLRLFGTLAGMAILCGSMSLSLRSVAFGATNAYYKECLDEAIASDDPDKKRMACINAINADPGAEGGYLELIDGVILKDGILSNEEDELLQEVFISRGNQSKSNLEVLSDNSDVYEEISYRLALAYFFQYEGSRNKSKSYIWFRRLSEMRSISEDKSEMVSRLGKISEYYGKISDNTIGTGEGVSYADLWSDIKGLYEYLSKDEGDAGISLMLLKELYMQIHLNGGSFVASGIDPEEIAYLKADLNEYKVSLLSRPAAEAINKDDAGKSLEEISAAAEGTVEGLLSSVSETSGLMFELEDTEDDIPEDEGGENHRDELSDGEDMNSELQDDISEDEAEASDNVSPEDDSDEGE